MRLQATVTPQHADSKFLVMTSGGNVFPQNEQTEIHIIHYVNVGGRQVINNTNTKGIIRNGLVKWEWTKSMQSTCVFYDANTTSQLVLVPYFKSTNGAKYSVF